MSEGCNARTFDQAPVCTERRRGPTNSVLNSTWQTAQVSRLYIVDMPGSERLLLDPELLRLREGSQVNQSLLAWATTLRRLASGAPSATANQQTSVLTKLLSGKFRCFSKRHMVERHQDQPETDKMRCY